jgi:phage shock protein PspC (stress-responsive transcriptional regulator)
MTNQPADSTRPESSAPRPETPGAVATPDVPDAAPPQLSAAEPAATEQDPTTVPAPAATDDPTLRDVADADDRAAGVTADADDKTLRDPAAAAEPATMDLDKRDEPLAPPAPPPGPLWPDADRPTSPPAGVTWPDAAGHAMPGSPVGDGSAVGGVGSPVGVGAGAGGPLGDGAAAYAAYAAAGDIGGTGPHAETQFGQAFKARYGLVRPIVGRRFAGVCAAVARATNTDPILWRVLFAVLTVFGGVGLLAYLIGWLLIPSDGDTASPVEAVLGRGRSRTSGPVAIIGVVVAVLVFAVVAAEGLRPAVVGALIVLGAAVLLSRGTLQRPAARPGETEPAPGQDTVPPAPPPHLTPTTGAPPAYPSSVVPISVPQLADAAWSQVRQPPQPPTYREPFAPHGPFVAPEPPRRLPLYGPYPPHLTGAAPAPAAYSVPPVSGSPLLQYPGLPQSVPPNAPLPKAPKPPRPKSRLGRATLSAMMVALGVVAIINVAGGNVDGSTYPAVALAIVGLGLVVGAWVGRARLLILLGVGLSIGLLGSTAAVHDSFDSGPAPRPEIWMPTTVAEVVANSPYNGSGNMILDLTQIDFSTTELTELEATMEFGRLQVILPPNVDAEIRAKVEVGDARVFDNKWGGLSDQRRTVIDNGLDGPGGGKLVLTLTVEVGNLEVTR